MNKLVMILITIVLVFVLMSAFYSDKETTTIYNLDNGSHLELKENEFYSTLTNTTLSLGTMDETCKNLLKMLRDSSYNVPLRIKDRCNIE